MIELLQNTDLHIAAKAIRTCKNSHDKSDTELYEIDHAIDDPVDFHLDGRVLEVGPKDKELIERIANKHKHGSVLEHLVYTYAIRDISRACLQELARHRIASLSVKSTRYTLGELKNEESFLTIIGSGRYDDYISDDSYDRAYKYIIETPDEGVNSFNIRALDNLRKLVATNTANDISKYSIPEAFKTELIWTINARSLQNFLKLRTSKDALWEIRELAFNIYDALPEQHKYLFKSSLGVR